MKFNLRHIVFWLTLSCVALAVLRRPILFLISGTTAQSQFLSGFALPFIHLLWLFNLEWVIDWDMLQSVSVPTPLFFAGAVLGGMLSFTCHILAAAFAGCWLQEAWAWCNAKETE